MCKKFFDKDITEFHFTDGQNGKATDASFEFSSVKYEGTCMCPSGQYFTGKDAKDQSYELEQQTSHLYYKIPSTVCSDIIQCKLDESITIFYRSGSLRYMKCIAASTPNLLIENGAETVLYHYAYYPDRPEYSADKPRPWTVENFGTEEELCDVIKPRAECNHGYNEITVDGQVSYQITGVYKCCFYEVVQDSDAEELIATEWTNDYSDEEKNNFKLSINFLYGLNHWHLGLPDGCRVDPYAKPSELCTEDQLKK